MRSHSLKELNAPDIKEKSLPPIALPARRASHAVPHSALKVWKNTIPSVPGSDKHMIAFLPAAVVNCGTRHSRIHKTHGRTFQSLTGEF